jgi:hypothetical protein
MTLQAGKLGLGGTRVLYVMFGVIVVGLSLWAGRPIGLSIIPLTLYFGWVPIRLSAHAGGKLKLESMFRTQIVDLTKGFTVAESRASKRVLRLKADSRNLRLGGFGKLDEVDRWLKKAQVLDAV